MKPVKNGKSKVVAVKVENAPFNTLHREFFFYQKLNPSLTSKFDDCVPMVYLLKEDLWIGATPVNAMFMELFGPDLWTYVYDERKIVKFTLKEVLAAGNALVIFEISMHKGEQNSSAGFL